MTLKMPELIRLKGDATEGDVIDAINRAVDGISVIAERNGDTSEAMKDLQEAQRKLQEHHANREHDFGSEDGMFKRYATPDASGTGHTLRVFGRTDESTGDWLPGLLDDTREGRSEIQVQLQRAVEDRAIATVIREGANPRARTSLTPIADKRLQRLIGQLPTDVQRAFVDAAGEGAELIPTDTLPTLLGEIEWMRNLSGLITEIEIDRDTKMPYLSAGLVPYVRGAGVDDDPPNLKASSLSLDERTFSLKNLSVRTLVDRDAAEDAILAMMPLLRMQIGNALIAGEEDLLINGDTGTHQDTGLASWNPDSYYAVAPGGGSNDHRRADIGIRARGFDVNNAATLASWGTSPDIAGIVAARHTLKGPKQGARDAVILPSGKALAAMAKIEGYQTLDKLGAGAYILTGQIARFNNMPVLENQFVTDDLNASGVFDGTTMTKGQLLMTLLSRWIRAVKRGHGVRIESGQHIGKNQIEIVGSRRVTYKNIGGSSEKNTYVGYNIA